MTTTETTIPDETAPATIDDEAPTDEAGSDEPAEEPGGSEAARYRRRLRDAEAERDALASRLETSQRREVEGLAGKLADPADLWQPGVELASVLDDDGNVDADKVAAAVAELIAAKPHYSKHGQRHPTPGLGLGEDDPGPRPGWADLLKG